MSMPSSPGKMDLSPLSGLKKRVLQPVPDSLVIAPVAPQQQVPQAAPAVAGASDTSPKTEPDTTEVAPAAESGDQTASAVVAPVSAPAEIKPAEEEHSGHVTLYLPKDLNQWLGEHHDSTRISYPGIVLNAISWAAADNRFGQIFAPDDSPIPANDIFGRAPAIPKPVRGSTEPETRPLRFRKDHMRVIISLARTWTADNRNAFFVGVLTAYRDQRTKDETGVQEAL